MHDDDDAGDPACAGSAAPSTGAHIVADFLARPARPPGAQADRRELLKDARPPRPRRR
jgi:hypothetical protein